MSNEYSSMQKREGGSHREHLEHPASAAPKPKVKELGMLAKVRHACKITAKTV
jgi:hypothetical protein